MSEAPRQEITESMTDQMAWNVIFSLAMDVAEKHGATITESARAVGPYAFVEAVQAMGHGLNVSWEGRTA
ncbi:hypothetical protein ACWC0A_30410 [Streptomyces scopuliridis]